MIRYFKSNPEFSKAIFSVSDWNLTIFTLNKPFLINTKRNQILKIKNEHFILNKYNIARRLSHTVYITQNTHCNANIFPQKKKIGSTNNFVPYTDYLMKLKFSTLK